MANNDQIPVDQVVVINQDLINLVSLNPGVPITVGSLINPSTIEVIDGCITRLMYQNDGNDLYFVQINGSKIISKADVSNLDDFRERLQEAANYGHGVTFCLDRTNKRIFMLHIIPCRCTCDKQGSRQPN